MRARIVFVVMLLLVVASLGASGWFARRLWLEHRTSSWPHVTGTITGAFFTNSKWGRGDDALISVVFDYEVAGVRRQAEGLAPLRSTGLYDPFRALGVDFSPGGRIEVWFDPEDPSRTRLMTGVDGADFAWFGASLLALFATVSVASFASMLAESAALRAMTPQRRLEWLRRTTARFVERARAAERSYARNPATYLVRLQLFALVPYAYLLLLFVVLLGAIALLAIAMLSGHMFIRVGWEVGAGLVIGLVILVRGVFGVFGGVARPAANPRAFPKLRARIDELTRKLEAPPVERFRFTSDFNMAMSELPMRTRVGSARNELTLGVPLLVSLSPAQFEAALAHEIGHLSARHSRGSIRLYLASMSLERVAQDFERRRSGIGLVVFLPFLTWFRRRIDPRFLAVKRRHELEADAYAAEVTEARSLADALTELELRGRFLEESARAVAASPATPPPDPATHVTRMLEALAAPRDPVQERERLKEILLQPTGVDATHPCLRERLAALGMKPRMPTPATHTAADEYLAEKKDEVVAVLEREIASAIRMLKNRMKPARWRVRAARSE